MSFVTALSLFSTETRLSHSVDRGYRRRSWWTCTWTRTPSAIRAEDSRLNEPIRTAGSGVSGLTDAPHLDLISLHLLPVEIWWKEFIISTHFLSLSCVFNFCLFQCVECCPGRGWRVKKLEKADWREPFWFSPCWKGMSRTLLCKWKCCLVWWTLDTTTSL